MKIKSINRKRKKNSPKGKGFFGLLLHKLFVLAKWIAILFFASSLFFVILFKYVNPPVTTFMLYKATSDLFHGNKFKISKKWVPVENISPNMIRAVIASEDNRFVDHWGIDTKAIQEAVDHNKKGKRIHGASTISQQTAKNVFLWPSRTYIRKGLEFYFTMLIEFIWGKQRIMEVYLNVVETGKGYYGVEKSARNNFNTSASRLTESQAALIAASLPSPRRYNPSKPGRYLMSRRDQIISLMYKIETLEIK